MRWSDVHFVRNICSDKPLEAVCCEKMKPRQTSETYRENNAEWHKPGSEASPIVTLGVHINTVLPVIVHWRDMTEKVIEPQNSRYKVNAY